MKIDISQINRSRDEVVSIIEQWIIGKNAERDRKIVVMSLVDGKCYETIAEIIGVSVSTVKRTMKKHKNRVLKHL